MREVQVIKCKCGKTFAGCLAPYCYSDSEWQRDMRKYVKRGCTVELIDSKDFNLENCVCKKELTFSLFETLATALNPNQ